jgi:hypothetical protein
MIQFSHMLGVKKDIANSLAALGEQAMIQGDLGRAAHRVRKSKG